MKKLVLIILVTMFAAFLISMKLSLAASNRQMGGNMGGQTGGHMGGQTGGHMGGGMM